MAEALNVSKSAVAKWETDGGSPDRENMIRIAEVFGTSIDTIYRMADGRSTAPGEGINITSDIIATLESYGYVVIAPNESLEDGAGPSD